MRKSAARGDGGGAPQTGRLMVLGRNKKAAFVKLNRAENTNFNPFHRRKQLLHFGPQIREAP